MSYRCFWISLCNCVPSLFGFRLRGHIFLESDIYLKLAWNLTSLVHCFSATGKVLALELPNNGNKKCTVLYPASAKASNEIGMCYDRQVCPPPLLSISYYVKVLYCFQFFFCFDRTIICAEYYVHMSWFIWSVAQVHARYYCHKKVLFCDMNILIDIISLLSVLKNIHWLKYVNN